MAESKTRSFWKYFFLTLKESKYLLFKYCLSAFLLVIIVILANLLDIDSLTYLNAFLSINYFASILGFGVATGINVLLNQSIKNKEQVQKFASTGFLWAVIISVISFVFLVSFPKFVMNGIMGLRVKDFTFYYAMCVYFFFVVLTSYLSHTLKNLKAFIHSMICDCFPLILGILGFVVLYCSGNYFLNYFSIIYIIMVLLGFIYAVFALYHNSIIKINIFNFSKLKLSMKQSGIILGNIVIELVWNVGFLAISIFLIRYNDAYFNTYSYLENVLDVLNGVFYAYASLLSIRIVRALGRNSYDEAYKHAKYFILSSFVIWCGYVVVTGIVLYPLAFGINRAYFDVIFAITGFYVLLYGVRFLNNCLTNYTLRSGGKNAVVFVMNIFCAASYITLCFVAKYLPQNMILPFALLAIPELISFVVCLIYFRSRKWMSNVNQNVQVDFEQIKLFIFDFDDVLQYTINWWEASKIINDYFYEHFSYMSRSSVNELLKPFSKRFGDMIGLAELENALMNVEGSMKSWDEFKQTQSLFIDEKRTIGICRKKLEKFKQKGAKICLVSNLNPVVLQAFFNARGFDGSVFDEIFIKNERNKKQSKRNLIKIVMHREKVVPEETFIVGDSYAEDVLIAKKLKLNYFKFKNDIDVSKIFNKKASQ